MQDALKTVTLDGTTYEVACFAPTQALSLIARITKVIGPAFASISAARGDAGDEDAIAKATVNAATLLCQGLDAAETVALVKELMQVVLVQGGRASDLFDGVFTGARFKHIFPLVREVIAHNHFFDSIGSLLNGSKA